MSDHTLPTPLAWHTLSQFMDSLYRSRVVLFLLPEYSVHTTFVSIATILTVKAEGEWINGRQSWFTITVSWKIVWTNERNWNILNIYWNTDKWSQLQKPLNPGALCPQASWNLCPMVEMCTWISKPIIKLVNSNKYLSWVT